MNSVSDGVSAVLSRADLGRGSWVLIGFQRLMILS